MPRRFSRRSLVAAAVVLAVAAAAAGISSAGEPEPAVPQNAYIVHNLVSDVAGTADQTDLNLVNAWGLAALPTSPWWVADNGTSVSTIYTANGSPQPLVVSVPSKPTGVVANSTLGFPVAIGSTSGPALFIFDTEEGKILGWNPNVALTQAIVVHRSRDGAIYKGLAMGSTATGTFLYAADFHNGKIDVFDTRFRQVTIPGAFADPGIPQRYAPFNIQNIGGELFVSYAKRDPLGEDEVAGPGLGFVDEYDTGGRLLMRVGSHDLLNAPWGLALAPVNFGRFGSDLLVGNFGDGRIIAYAPKPDGTFAREGVLRQPDGKPVEVDGLWALQFGLGHRKNGPTDTLFFTAGPDDEGHGLFGTIRAGTS